MPPLCAATLTLVVHHTNHRDEADEFVEIGALNGIFVLGRSMGFIGESFHVQKHCCGVYSVVCIRMQDGTHFNTINLSFFLRTLPGPEEAEAGSLSPPVG